MDTIINFLDYQVEKNNTTKNTFGLDILYKNDNFSLLKCNKKNNNIYISGTNFEYKEDYCK